MIEEAITNRGINHDEAGMSEVEVQQRACVSHGQLIGSGAAKGDWVALSSVERPGWGELKLKNEVLT